MILKTAIDLLHLDMWISALAAFLILISIIVILVGNPLRIMDIFHVIIAVF